MDVRELAWASGLFDGEGCISISANCNSGMLYPQLTLAMTDEDSVVRFQRAVGVGRIRTRLPHGTNARDLFVWTANSFEAGQAVAVLLWYGLSARRRSRAVEVFRSARDSQDNRKTMRRGSECSFEGCPDAVLARTLCSKHYQRTRNAA